MDINELNLEELMEINGGDNEARVLLASLAQEHNLVEAGGKIDLAQLKLALTASEIEQLALARENLVLAEQRPVNGGLFADKKC